MDILSQNYVICHAIEIKNGEILKELNIGTNEYFAPEMVINKSYDEFKIDIIYP